MNTTVRDTGAVSCSGLVKTYRSRLVDVDVLRSINLRVDAGSFVALMGPSGAGKTTLLNCLSGLDDFNRGSVTIDGVELASMSDAKRTAHRASSMGFIFQAFNLIPVFSSVENVEMPLLLAGVPARQARAAAQRTLERVGLSDRQTHRPAELSGGEQQRVAVARAIAGQPAIVWADEPTGNLDGESAQSVMDLLGELHAEGVTIILVTHSDEIAARASRRIVVRDGRIASDEVGR